MVGESPISAAEGEVFGWRGAVCLGKCPSALVREDARHGLMHPSVQLRSGESGRESIPWLRSCSRQHTVTFYPQALFNTLMISKLFLKESRIVQDRLFTTAQMLCSLCGLSPSLVKHL